MRFTSLHSEIVCGDTYTDYPLFAARSLNYSTYQNWRAVCSFSIQMFSANCVLFFCPGIVPRRLLNHTIPRLRKTPSSRTRKRRGRGGGGKDALKAETHRRTGCTPTRFVNISNTPCDLTPFIFISKESEIVP